MAGFNMPTMPIISPAIQNMIMQESANTRSTFTGNSPKGWLIIIAAVFGIVFLVKKMGK